MSERAKRKWERRSAAFRESALERMKRGENGRALAKELGVPKSLNFQAEADLGEGWADSPAVF